MQNFETAAIISLVDHLSAPLRKLAEHVGSTGSTFDKNVKRMEAVGSSLTYKMTLPLLAMGKHLSDQALEFSKVENTLQGVLLNRARTMKGLTVTGEEFARSQKVIIDQATEAAYKSSGGLSNDLEYRKAAMQAVKAGLDTEAAVSVARQSVDLAMAGRIDQHEAADHLITLGNAFGVVTKNADGSTKAIGEIMPQYQKLADLLATMSTNSNMTSDDAFASLKLSAPLAKEMGLDPGVLGAMSEAMAEKGYRGSEASVAQRSFLLALMAPKSSASPSLLRAGVDMGKFQHFRDGFEMTPEAFDRYAINSGYKVNTGEVKRGFDKARAEADKEGAEFSFGTYLGQTLTGVLKHTGKKGSPVAPYMAQKIANKFVSQGVDGFDALGFILEAREKHLTPEQLSGFMEKRQIPRVMPFLEASKPGEFDPFDYAMKRAFGENWKQMVDDARAKGVKAELVPQYLGNAARMAKEHAQDLEGAYKRIENSFTNLTYHLFKAGAFDAVASGLNKIAHGVDILAAQDPQMLKFEAGALALVAGLGPLLIMGATAATAGKAFAQLAVGLARVMGLAEAASVAKIAGKGAGAAAAAVEGAEVAAAVPAAVVAGLTAIGAAAAVTGAIALDKYRKANPEDFHARAQGAYKKIQDGQMGPFRHWVPEPGRNRAYAGHYENGPEHVEHDFGPAPAKPIGTPRLGVPSHPWNYDGRNIFGGEGSGAFITAGINHESGPVKAIDAVLEKLGVEKNVNVQGDVKGEATIMQTIRIDPSPLLIATLQGAENALKMNLSGKLGQTMKGSNAAMGSVAPGLTSFRPTVSGR
jgi:hypothetical protein